MVQQKEAKLVNEWLQINHPKALQWKRVRLGPLPDKELSRMYSVTQRWVDAVYVEDGVVHLLEAKLKPQLGAISQLEAYEELFRQTPEFDAYSEFRLKLVLLTTRRDPLVESMAKQRGMEYHVYAPAWLWNAGR